jgi:hypothetical protein
MPLLLENVLFTEITSLYFRWPEIWFREIQPGLAAWAVGLAAEPALDGAHNLAKSSLARSTRVHDLRKSGRNNVWWDREVSPTISRAYPRETV